METERLNFNSKPDSHAAVVKQAQEWELDLDLDGDGLTDGQEVSKGNQSSSHDSVFSPSHQLTPPTVESGSEKREFTQFVSGLCQRSIATATANIRAPLHLGS